MYFTPEGSMHVYLKKHSEHYTISRPVTSANNLILGTPYIDQHGKSLAKNHKTGHVCDVEYKRRGWGGKNAGRLEGDIKDKNGQVVGTVYGTWSEKIQFKDSNGKESEVWKINDKIENWDHLYHFTLFGL